MNRVIIVIILLLALFFLFARGRKKTPKKEDPPHSENMVRCAHCGVHIPKGESITVEQQDFCSEAHRLAHLGKSE